MPSPGPRPLLLLSHRPFVASSTAERSGYRRHSPARTDFEGAGLGRTGRGQALPGPAPWQCCAVIGRFGRPPSGPSRGVTGSQRLLPGEPGAECEAQGPEGWGLRAAAPPDPSEQLGAQKLSPTLRSGSATRARSDGVESTQGLRHEQNPRPLDLEPWRLGLHCWGDPRRINVLAPGDVYMV